MIESEIMTSNRRYLLPKIGRIKNSKLSVPCFYTVFDFCLGDRGEVRWLENPAMRWLADSGATGKKFSSRVVRRRDPVLFRVTFQGDGWGSWQDDRRLIFPEWSRSKSIISHTGPILRPSEENLDDTETLAMFIYLKINMEVNNFSVPKLMRVS